MSLLTNFLSLIRYACYNTSQTPHLRQLKLQLPNTPTSDRINYTPKDFKSFRPVFLQWDTVPVDTKSLDSNVEYTQSSCRCTNWVGVRIWIATWPKRNGCPFFWWGGRGAVGVCDGEGGLKVATLKPPQSYKVPSRQFTGSLWKIFSLIITTNFDGYAWQMGHFGRISLVGSIVDLL